MKRIFFEYLLAIFMLLALPTVFADNVCQQVTKRNLVCGKGTVPSVSFTGDVSLNGTTIVGLTSLTGNLDSSNARLNKVSESGSGKFDNTILLGSLSSTGSVNAIGSTFQDISVSSSVVASNSSFGSSKVSGNLNVDSVTFNQSAFVSGDMTSKECNFLKDVSLSGNLTATNSTFEGNLNISSVQAVLVKTTTRDIVNSQRDGADIYLEDQSKVDGSITFKYGEANKNVVHMESGTQISGQVVNGIIVKS